MIKLSEMFGQRGGSDAFGRRAVKKHRNSDGHWTNICWNWHHYLGPSGSGFPGNAWRAHTTHYCIAFHGVCCGWQHVAHMWLLYAAFLGLSSCGSLFVGMVELPFHMVLFPCSSNVKKDHIRLHHSGFTWKILCCSLANYSFILWKFCLICQYDR